MTTDQLEENLRREFHRLDQRMIEEGNLDLPAYVASAPARRQWVRLVAVTLVAAAVVLLIPILKPSDKPAPVRLADVPLILPGETRSQAVERIRRACMVEGGFAPTDGASGSPSDVAGYETGAEMAARLAACANLIEDLGIAEPQIVLPGETPFAAQIRITDACMAEGGIPSAGEVSVSENNGPFIPGVAYKDSPETRARQDICGERFLALGILKTPTGEQWAAFYPHVVALVDCLTAKGFNMGTTISLDEYVSSGAKTPVSPKLAELDTADTTDPKYWECVQKEITPYTSILQT
jgi:predicted secreted protein